MIGGEGCTCGSLIYPLHSQCLNLPNDDFSTPIAAVLQGIPRKLLEIDLGFLPFPFFIFRFGLGKFVLKPFLVASVDVFALVQCALCTSFPNTKERLVKLYFMLSKPSHNLVD